MYLKSIEMVGFKSFVDTTRLEFPTKLSAVVGPNGCGKSNIIDAIRWVIGEQNTKMLRGNRMEDLIFNGSDTRKPLGMVEVSLTVGNLAYKVSMDGLKDLDEVTVTRRYLRSGESNYFINKTPCRMKDIIDLFLDTGISSRAFSIMQQDHVTQVINAKPVERRSLIEEAAGILKYKNRKNEALRKLEYTSQNLLRIEDVVRELDKQRGSLKRQAKKAEVYKKFKKEIRELGLAVHSIEYRKQRENHINLEEKLTESKDRQEELIAKNSAMQNKIETHKAETDENEREWNLLKQQNYEINGKIGNIETRIEMMKKQIIDHEVNGKKAEEEIRRLVYDLENFNHLVDSQRKKIEIAARDIAALEEKFGDKNNSLQEIKNSLQLKTEDLEDLESNLVDTINANSKAKSNEASLTTRCEILEQNKSKLIKELSESEIFFNDISVAVEKNKESLLNAEKNLLRTKEEKEALNLRLEEERSRLIEGEADLNSVKNVYTENTALFNSLNELYTNFEGFHEGVKSIMKPQHEQEKVEGIHDVLVNLVDIDSKYEAALEAALGEKVQGIVMNSQNESVRAVQYLKEKTSGRSTFFMLNPKLSQHTELSLNGNRGVVGKLLELANFDGKYKEVMKYLLGNTVVVDNIESALSVWEHIGDKCTVVTLGGDVIDSHGTITGGVPVNNGASLLNKKRKIIELKAQTDKLNDQIELLKEKQSAIEGTINNLEKEKGIIEKNNNEAEEEFREEEKENHKLNDELCRSGKKLETCRFEKEQCEAEEKELSNNMEKLQLELAELNNARLKEEAAIKNTREEINSFRADMESLIQEVNSLDVEKTSLNGKKDNILIDIQRIESNIELTHNRTKQKEDEKTEYKNKTGELVLNIEKGGEEIITLNDDKNIIEKKVVNLGELLEEQLHTLKEMQGRAKIGQTEQVEIGEEVNRFEISRAEIVKDLQYLIEKAKEEFYATEEQLLELNIDDFDLESGKEKLDDLKVRIRKIGEVNLAALEEYDRVNERFTFLTTQRDDLHKSIADLQETINKINRTTKKKFLETFELVNKNFKTIFTRLFKGGQAELILSDDDILETGIDVEVKPPGKRLQNINLLSGGEKAMTAISLLFAIFAVRPSPFCLLDEVDAALDQANIGCFKDMLVEMKEKTQFILVTHSQKTMSFAETLYGVTMEEKGVSKIVSVDLHGDASKN